MRRFLSGALFVFLGLPVALSSLFALSIRSWALDPAFYSKALTDARLYSILRSPEILEAVDGKIVIDGYTFSGPGIAAAIQKHLPEAELKQVAVATAEGVVGRAARGELPADIDLRPLKTALQRDSGAIVADYLASLPAPKPGAAAGDAKDLSVRAANLPATSLSRPVKEAFAAAVKSIPDTVDIPDSKAIAVKDGSGAVLTQGRVGKPALDTLAFAGTGFSALFLLGLGFMGGRGTARSLARTGRMMILPSALVLAVGVALALPGAPILNLLPAEASQALGTAVMQDARAWLASWLGVASRWFFVTGLVGTSLGGLLVSARRFLEPSEL
jgi:hypothetical protein